MSIAVPSAWPDEVSIRPAVKADIPRLAQIFVASQRAHGNSVDHSGVTVDRVMAWMVNALVLDEIWALKVGGDPVGLFALTNRELDILDVRPDMRRRGYGARLMEAAKVQRPQGLIAKVGRNRGIARSFVTRQGFRSTGEWEGDVEVLEWRRDPIALAGRHKGGLTLLAGS